MTTSNEKKVFYVHYYESDSSGGELPLMRIEAESEEEANKICLQNLADVYDVNHDDISLEDGFEVNGNSVYLQGIYPATAEQVLVVDVVFGLALAKHTADTNTGDEVVLLEEKFWLDSWFDLDDTIAELITHVSDEDKSDTRFIHYGSNVIDIRECSASSISGWDFQYGLSGGTQMLFVRLADDGDYVTLGIQ